MKKVIPIESVINIYDPNIVWADLSPNYNGYQISNTGLVRSMKFFKKYPYGVLLEPNDKGILEISNSLNERCTIDVNATLQCTPRNYFIIPTNSIYTRSRNPLITSQSKVMKDKLKYRDILKQPSGFHFTTIDQNKK